MAQPTEREGIRRTSSRRGLWIIIGVVVIVAVLLSVAVLAGWFGSSGTTLLGAGATFPYPLISKWSVEYEKQTGVQVNYQSIGSGGGITQVTAKTVDFGASDAPLKPSERAAAPNLLHIPETIGAVTLAYNLPGVPSGLNLTGGIVAGMFMGNITWWDDANITSLNPSSNLPHQRISPIHRSDGSGTTFVFTDYLAKVNSTWVTVMGPASKSVGWPTNVGFGSKGNEGVAGFVAGNRYACGYIELAYASQLNPPLTFARIKNQDGVFTLPTLNTTQAAVDTLSTSLPNGEDDWANVSVTNAPGTNSYPISSMTYLLVYRELNVYGAAMTQVKAKALVAFLWWAVHDGQQFSEPLSYVKLPAGVVTVDERTIGLITYNGQPLRG